MEQIPCVDLEAMPGKTIKSVVSGWGDEYLLIVFTDGSLIQFHVSVYDEEGSLEAYSFLCPTDFELPKLASAIRDIYPDIISELEAKEAAAHSEAMKRKAKYERSEFERLKAKFEKAD
jgi:hypothetical protein